jgi:hypothetical protein
MREVRDAPATGRSVVGMMNGFVFMAGHHRDHDGDLTVTSTHLAHTRAARSARATPFPARRSRRSSPSARRSLEGLAGPACGPRWTRPFTSGTQVARRTHPIVISAGFRASRPFPARTETFCGHDVVVFLRWGRAQDTSFQRTLRTGGALFAAVASSAFPLWRPISAELCSVGIDTIRRFPTSWVSARSGRRAGRFRNRLSTIAASHT